MRCIVPLYSMKKQLAAASGGRKATQTLELIYGHIANAYHSVAPGVAPEGKYAGASKL